MCGIIGYIGKNNCDTYLVDGLKALEYRGYDSAGVAISGNDALQIIKSVGKVSVLETAIKATRPVGTCGIAHTRWATHGQPTENNSHPHTDCNNEIAVVHNGIIENFLHFKENLIKNGHKFKSETDTEVISHLLEDKLKNVTENYEENFIKAITEISKELNGSYAITALWKKAPNIIVGTKKKSPLVIGIGDNENFFGSDVSAFQNHTSKAVYLNDNDIAILTKNSLKIYDNNGNNKDYKIVTIENSGSSAGKNGLEHYMLKEIREQSSTIKSTIENVIKDIDTAFDINPNEIKNIKNILLIGCGTAFHATMVAKYWIEEFTNIPTQAELASEYKYRKVAMPSETLGIFVSQSGETADTVAALEKAKDAGFKTIAICNVYNSTITRISDYTFYTKCGPEISVASTKAFTSQLAALFALSLFIGKSSGNLKNNEVNKYIKELAEIPNAVEKAIHMEDSIKELAERYYRDKSFVFLGRNVNYPIALEAALKLKEITYLQAEGFAAGEIKHGPIALLTIGTPVISIVPYDSLFDKMANACEEVMARGAETVAITDNLGDKELDPKIKLRVILDNTPEYLFPIVSIIPLQLFAYHIARLNEREIDQPRNLAKSVTVE